MNDMNPDTKETPWAMAAKEIDAYHYDRAFDIIAVIERACREYGETLREALRKEREQKDAEFLELEILRAQLAERERTIQTLRDDLIAMWDYADDDTPESVNEAARNALAATKPTP